MSEAFDPYHKWLAIPAREQPPDHYRLLAIERFESDLDVISHAADQRMSHIKRFQSGPHAALSQKLLNEIAKASSCLLDAESKAKYDADLAAAAAPSRPAPRPQAERSAPIARAVEIAAAPVQTTTRPHHSRSLKKAKKRQSNIRWLGHIVAPIAGLVLGYIILSLARPDLSIFSRSSESNGESPEVAVTDDVDSGESRRPKGKSRRPRNKQRDQANTGATDSATKDSSPEGGTDGAIDPSQDPSQQNGTHPNGTETDGGTDGEVKDPANGGDIEPPPQPTQEEIVAQLKTELDTAVTAGDIPAALTATDKLANYAEDPLALELLRSNDCWRRLRIADSRNALRRPGWRHWKTPPRILPRRHSGNLPTLRFWQRDVPTTWICSAKWCCDSWPYKIRTTRNPSFFTFQPPSAGLDNPTLPVEILYEQGPCLVVLKPAGLLTQAPPGIDSLENRIKAHLKARDNKPGNIYLGVPHRLDRPVSGAMVFARHVRACRRLSDQFEGRTVRKVYWACVVGTVDPPQGTWRDNVRKIPDEARAEIVPAAHPDAREAILHYRVVGETAWGSWLEIELETGRTHQIRIQASSRGHPVLGDEMYGAQVAFGPQTEDRRLRSIALHGRSLTFLHPMTHEKISVTAPLPAAWNGLTDKLP